jgi:chromate transporter
VDDKRVSLLDIFTVFAKLALTSFGGGLSGWMHRELVQKRRWFGEQDFITSLAIAQAMPGVNVVNLAVWLGFRLRGTLGAGTAFCGIVLPSVAVVIPVSIAYAQWGRLSAVHAALAGIAAAALALTLNIGLRVSISASRDAVAIAILIVVFVGVGILRLPMVPLVAVMAPLSIGWALMRRSPA